MEPQPKTEWTDPGKEVDILSTMIPYYLDSYSLKCTSLDVGSILITSTSHGPVKGTQSAGAHAH